MEIPDDAEEAYFAQNLEKAFPAHQIEGFG